MKVAKKILIVIPARYGSSRFPGKPLALINGKPMIYWTYNQAKKVRGCSDVIVATDDDRIENECNRWGIPSLMTRDDHRTGTDRLAEVAEKMKADIYVNIQGDEPLIEPHVVEEMIAFLVHNTNYVCATIRSVIENPIDAVNTTVSKVVTDVNGDIMYISKQPIPYPKASLKYDYYKALGIYAFRPPALEIYRDNSKALYEETEDIELLRLIERGIRIRALVVNSHSPSVDTPKDLIRIEEMMGK